MEEDMESLGVWMDVANWFYKLCILLLSILLLILLLFIIYLLIT